MGRNPTIRPPPRADPLRISDGKLPNRATIKWPFWPPNVESLDVSAQRIMAIGLARGSLAASLAYCHRKLCLNSIKILSEISYLNFGELIRCPRLIEKPYPLYTVKLRKVLGVPVKVRRQLWVRNLLKYPIP